MKCGIDFYIGYSPERINPGDEAHDLTKITKIVAGMDKLFCKQKPLLKRNKENIEFTTDPSKIKQADFVCIVGLPLTDAFMIENK